jgi:hypothetical protein
MTQSYLRIKCSKNLFDNSVACPQKNLGTSHGQRFSGPLLKKARTRAFGMVGLKAERQWTVWTH